MSILTTMIKIDAVNLEFPETCYAKNNILYGGTLDIKLSMQST